MYEGIYIGSIEKKPEKLESMYFGLFSKSILVFDTLVSTCTNIEVEAYMYQEIHDWVVFRDSTKILIDFARDFLYIFLLSNIFHYRSLCSNFLMPDHLFVRFEIALFLVTPVYLFCKPKPLVLPYLLRSEESLEIEELVRGRQEGGPGRLRGCSKELNFEAL